MVELHVMRAAHFQAVLGAYDRFGWRHLGPAYFYALVPLYVLAGERTRGLPAAQMLVNLLAVVAVVAVVGRRHGLRLGLWSAAASVVYLLALGPSRLMYPWNPLVLGPTTLLTLVLAAEAAAGSVGALAWATAVGTLAVQAELSVVPIVGFGLLAGLVGLLLGRRTAPRERSASTAAGGSRASAPGTSSSPRLGRRISAGAVSWVAMLGVAVAALLWVPPLVQQATGRPGNIGQVVRFFTTSHPGLGSGHSWHSALYVVGAQLTLVHLGLGGPGIVAPSMAASMAALAVVAADAVVVTVAGLRLRSRITVAFGVVTGGGLAVAAASASRIIGPIHVYLVAWMAILDVLAAIGSGAAVACWWCLRRDAPGRRPRWARSRWAPRLPARSAPIAGLVLLLVAAGTPAGILTARFASGTRTGFADAVEVPPLAAAVERAMGQMRARHVVVRLADPQAYPAAAGLVVALVHGGLAVSVQRSWVAIFGKSFTPTGSEPVAAVVSDPAVAGSAGPPRSALATASSVGPTGPVEVWVVAQHAS